MEQSVQKQSDAQPYSTNLLTQQHKTEESIRAAKERVDANEK